MQHLLTRAARALRPMSTRAAPAVRIAVPAAATAAPADADDCPIRPSPPPRDLPFGVWPDDPDEVPAWRIAAETTAAIYGYVLPCYRTRREFESAIGLCEAVYENTRMQTHARATIADRSTMTGPAKSALKGPISPDRAAREFIAALRRQERTGTYTAAEIYAAYLDHCTGESRVPCSETVIKTALARIPGVTHALKEDRLHGRRHRPTIWTISADARPKAVSSSMITTTTTKPVLRMAA